MEHKDRTPIIPVTVDYYYHIMHTNVAFQTALRTRVTAYTNRHPTYP